MTFDDRKTAFEMRCRGKTWEEIGAAMHYDASSVRKDIESVVEQGPRISPIIYPAIRKYVLENCKGSTEAFARSIGASPSRMREVLHQGRTPRYDLLQKILKKTGLTEEEAFHR